MRDEEPMHIYLYSYEYKLMNTSVGAYVRSNGLDFIRAINQLIDHHHHRYLIAFYPPSTGFWVCLDPAV